MSETWQGSVFGESRKQNYYDQKGRSEEENEGSCSSHQIRLNMHGILQDPFTDPSDSDSNVAKIQRIDQLEEETILFALDRLHHEVQELFWPPDQCKSQK